MTAVTWDNVFDVSDDADSAADERNELCPYFPRHVSYLALNSFGAGGATSVEDEADLPPWSWAPYDEAQFTFGRFHDQRVRIKLAVRRRRLALTSASRRFHRQAVTTPLVSKEDIERSLRCALWGLDVSPRAACRRKHLCPFCTASVAARDPYRHVAALAESLLIGGETVYAALDSSDVLHANSQPLPPAREYLRTRSRVDRVRCPEAVTADGSGAVRAVVRAAWPLPAIARGFSRTSRRTAAVPILRVRYLRICTGEPPQPLPSSNRDRAHMVRRINHLTDLVPLVGALYQYPAWFYEYDIGALRIVDVLSWLGKPNPVVCYGALSRRSAHHPILGSATGTRKALAAFAKLMAMRYDTAREPTDDFERTRRLAARSTGVTLQR